VLVGCTPASETGRFLDAVAPVSGVFGASANAGDARDGLGWDAEPAAAADRYAAFAERWIDAGASIVGGCCGTRPEHVARLRIVLNERCGRRLDRS
jgi:S-methylmethionine-dependent homocysteine/selenocysteine methylase